MSNEIEIKYTPAGKERLEILHSRFYHSVEKALKERRYVPGDPYIEVTASDIEDLSKSLSLQFNNRDVRRKALIRQASYFYVLAGVLAIAGGVFYEQIKRILENQHQSPFVVLGVLLIIAGTTLRFMSSSEEFFVETVKAILLRRTKL